MTEDTGSHNLEVLKTVKQKAEEIMLADPSASNIASYERAVKALAAAAGPPPDDDDQLTFAHRLAAMEWLQDQGYKIKKSKLYADAKNGLLKIESDGSVTEKELNRYIRRARLLKPAKQARNDGDDDQQRLKQQKELERLSEQIENLRFDRSQKQGNYILKSDHELELASRAAALQAYMRYCFHMHCGRMLDAAEKEETRRRRAAVLEEKLNYYFDKAITEFVNLENYHVIFIDDAAN